MQSPDSSIASVALPSDSVVTGFYPTTDLADAYAIRLPDNAIQDPESLARFIFGQQPSWITALLKVRDPLVAGFGLETAAQLKTVAVGAAKERVSIFRIYEANAHEIILGEDDKHLDFRLSVLYRPKSLEVDGRTPQ